MCRNCFNRCNNCCCRCSSRNCYVDDRCDDFIWPMLFWVIRDMSRHCRCNWVDRYDRYRY